MHTNGPTSTEVESFTVAITDLFWGSNWADIKPLARRAWSDCTQSGVSWKEVESIVENRWNAIQASGTGARRQDDQTRESLEKHDLCFVLERIHRGNASLQDIARAGLLGGCFIDSSEPPKLTDVGQEILQALQATARPGHWPAAG